ncbi:uncharacterized protein LOC133914453 [Phragmites australis]|uniref:uncharacterized protein LOC133914453 n=1 Tax=Phragmites australis TaxID=29695 RepID=UPI002D76D330|nr:uncharacterized protein LOC133914453 [Phragmites australis]
MVTPDPTSSSSEMEFLITPCSRQRSSFPRVRGSRDRGKLRSYAPVSRRQQGPGAIKEDNSGTFWSWNSASPTSTTPLIMGNLEASSSAPSMTTTLTRSKARPWIEMPFVKDEGNTPSPILFEYNANIEKPLITVHEGSTDAPPATAQTLQVTNKAATSTSPEHKEGRVKKIVAKIEKVASSSPLLPLPSLYTSVATPLEVWVVPDPQGYTSPTLFYKVPHTQCCNLVLNFPDTESDKEEIIGTLRVEPNMVPLLERSGIKLRRNQRLPSPPNVCEEWWSQSERLVKKGRLPRTR